MKESAHFQRGYSLRTSNGFTLVEAIIVIGMSVILVAIAIIALRGPQARNSVETTATTFVSDIKQQQLLSMMGDSGSQILAQAHGVRITANSYTLFTGSAFTGSTNQFVVNLAQGLSFSGVSFPQDILFAKRSGETTVLNNLVIRNTAGDQRTININRLGALTVN